MNCTKNKSNVRNYKRQKRDYFIKLKKNDIK